MIDFKVFRTHWRDGEMLAGKMSRGPWNKCERGAFPLSRLCRESLLTFWKPDTLPAVAGDGVCFSSPAAAPRRVRGLGQSPKVLVVVVEVQVVRGVRKAMHSPTPLWDTKPVGEHLACIVRRLLVFRTVAGWRVPSGRDPVFARMENDKRF